MKHPISKSVQVETIPNELKLCNQWVAWRYEQRNGRPTKVPYRVDTLTSASTSDSTTWGEYETALNALDSKDVDGIGFVFTTDDPFVGVDLDNCLDTQQQLKPWAQTIVEGLDSYAEISPSGTGVKLILAGKKNTNRCCTKIGDGKIEIYDTGRYFTITGQLLAPAYTTIETRQEALETVCQQVFRATTATTSSSSISSTVVIQDDERLRDRMCTAKNGEKVKRLLHGDIEGFGSHSEADLALATHLAFWTGKDRSRMDSLFRSSGLFRDKWDEVHAGNGQTYGEMTMDKACQGVRATYDPWFAHSNGSTGAASESYQEEQRLFPRDTTFPIDALPLVMQKLVVEIADKRNVHPALVATAALCVVASSVQNIADVQTRGWSPHPLSLWAIMIAASGDGKTRGMRDAARQFQQIEHKKANDAKRAERENKSVIAALRREATEQARKAKDGCSWLDHLTKSEATTTGTMPIHNLREIDRKIYDLENPRPQSCMFNDHTPEQMFRDIEFTGERAAAIANESRFLDLALGLVYQKGAGISNLIQMWDGDPIEHGRKSDGLSKVYSHPVLTMCLCMTPEKFEGSYRRLPLFTDEGFGQRFLFIHATVPLKGKSEVNPDASILQAWDKTIRTLAEMEIPLSDDNKPQPNVVSFDEEAETFLTDLSNQLAGKMNDHRDKMLPFWASWNTRIFANIIRIAGLLHAVRHGSSFIEHEICFEDTEAATRIMKFYCSQAETIINGTSENEIERVQRIIREYLDNQKRGFGFTLRSLNQNLTKSITGDKNQRRADKIRIAFEALMEDGYPVVEIRDGKRKSYERT